MKQQTLAWVGDFFIDPAASRDVREGRAAWFCAPPETRMHPDFEYAPGDIIRVIADDVLIVVAQIEEVVPVLDVVRVGVMTPPLIGVVLDDDGLPVDLLYYSEDGVTSSLRTQLPYSPWVEMGLAYRIGPLRRVS